MATQSASDIDALYRQLFGRQADPQGLAFWLGKDYVQPAQLRSEMIAGAAPQDFAAYTASTAAQSDPIAQHYQTLFGRSPDQEGYQYWRGKSEQLGTGNPLREAMAATAAPTDATYFNNRNVSGADWEAYQQRAAQQDRGINNMPGVFTDYAALAGKSPAETQAMLYHTPESLKATQGAWASLYGGLGSLGALGGASATPQQSQPTNRGTASRS